MSTPQQAASPRAPRGQPRPESTGRSQRRRGGRNHNNGNGASPSKPPRDPVDNTSGEDRKRHSHTRAQPSIDRSQAPIDHASPAKSQAYAGPTFHASPAPSALPIPKFLSRSVPAKTQGPPTPPPDDSDSGNTASPSPSPSRAIAIPQHDSPLDMLFRADKAERAKANFSPYSPATLPATAPATAPAYDNVFPIELDGESKVHSPPPAASPRNDQNDVMQDLFQRLSMSQKKAAPIGSPLRHQTPPFQDRSATRCVSGPTTPAQQQQQEDFFYGNRNLSPLFKAAKDDTPKRNSGLRTEVTAQDFPSIPQPQGNRRGSVPHRQQPSHHHPQHPHVTKTPGRYPQRPRGNNHSHSPGFRKPAPVSPAAPAKPATTMMSFVPASVSAKPKQPAPMKTSTPPDSLALEQDLKRMLNLNMTGDNVAGVR